MQNISQMSKHSIFTTITNATKAPLCTNVSSLSNHNTQSWMVTNVIYFNVLQLLYVQPLLTHVNHDRNCPKDPRYENSTPCKKISIGLAALFFSDCIKKKSLNTQTCFCHQFQFSMCFCTVYAFLILAFKLHVTYLGTYDFSVFSFYAWTIKCQLLSLSVCIFQRFGKFNLLFIALHVVAGSLTSQ